MTVLLHRNGHKKYRNEMLLMSNILILIYHLQIFYTCLASELARRGKWKR